MALHGLAALLLVALFLPAPLALAEDAPPAAESPADAHLRGGVESWLLHVQGLGPHRVAVRVEDGVVTLTGTADSPEQIDLIVGAVAAFEGVRRVVDRLVAVTAEDLDGTGPEESAAESRWKTWFRWLSPPEGRRYVRFPRGDLFTSPLADQKQPRFHMTYQRMKTDFGWFNVGSVGFGENFGLLRSPGEAEGDGWQLGISGAVFALFNLDAASSDLLNADYYVGFPLSFRRGVFSGRARLFHLSSHLGDEYLLEPQPDEPVERINLSYEALELLLSWEHRGFRVYGGGFHILHTVTPLGRDRAQAGAELRGRLLGWHTARAVAGIDLQAWDETGWDVDLSVKAGIRVDSPYGGDRSVMFLLEFYDGHLPHGQFYVREVRYYGFGITFAL